MGRILFAMFYLFCVSCLPTDPSNVGTQLTASYEGGKVKPEQLRWSLVAQGTCASVLAYFNVSEDYNKCSHVIKNDYFVFKLDNLSQDTIITYAMDSCIAPFSGIQGFVECGQDSLFRSIEIGECAGEEVRIPPNSNRFFYRSMRFLNGNKKIRVATCLFNSRGEKLLYEDTPVFDLSNVPCIDSIKLEKF